MAAVNQSSGVIFHFDGRDTPGIDLGAITYTDYEANVFFIRGSDYGIGIPYYIATSHGADANNGLSKGTAWQLSSKVTDGTFPPGAQIFFRGGETYGGFVLSAANSGTSAFPVTISTFGTGDALQEP